MSELTMIARSPITPTLPVEIEAGWEVSGRRSGADLTIVDETPRTKILVKARWDGPLAQALGVRFGRAARDETGTLVVGSGPGEWLLLAAPSAAAEVTARAERLATEVANSELVSVIDLTHGRALIRITGGRAAVLLAKVCGFDFSEAVTPNGGAFRSSVAKLATDIVRDDRHGVRSYLLHSERSSGQYLFDALFDAGREFGIEIDGWGGCS